MAPGHNLDPVTPLGSTMDNPPALLNDIAFSRQHIRKIGLQATGNQSFTGNISVLSRTNSAVEYPGNLLVSIGTKDLQQIAVKHGDQDVLINRLFAIAREVLQLKTSLYLLIHGLDWPTLSVELPKQVDGIFTTEKVGCEIFVFTCIQLESKNTDKKFRLVFLPSLRSITIVLHLQPLNFFRKFRLFFKQNT